MVPALVKISRGKSRCVINIPVKLAKAIGLDKADFALVIKKGSNKLEVKRYDSDEDYAEYIPTGSAGSD